MRMQSAGRGRPADDRWKRACGSPNHDVLGRAPLQSGSVNDNTKENREGEQRGREPIERNSEDGESEPE